MHNHSNKKTRRDVFMNKSIRFLAKTAMVAAIYAVLTVLIAPLAYGAVQFRFTEIMTLLAFVDPLYIPGLLTGCFIANLFGSGGMIDAVFGTLHSAVSLMMLYFSARWFRNRPTLGLIVSSLWFSIFSFIIAYEMTMLVGLEGSFWFWTGSVALGEFVVITIIGVPLFSYLLSKSYIVKIIKKIRD